MKINALHIICLFALLSVAVSAPAAPATTPSIEITDEGKISAVVENGSLNDMLRVMSDKMLFEVKGALPGGEITLHFSNLSLDEAIKKIMRGYNYVLINQGASRKPLLLLMGKVERSKYTEGTAAVRPPQRPVNQPANQASDPRMYVPPVTLPPPAPAPARPAPPGSLPQPGGRIAGPPRLGPGMVPAMGVPANPAGSEQKGPQQQEPDKAQPKDGQGPDHGPQAGQGPEGQQPGGMQSSGVPAKDLLNNSHFP